MELPENDLQNETPVQTFIRECRLLIQDMHLMIQTDIDSNIREIYRAVHNIKGTSAYLNFENIKSVTLETENLIQNVRQRKDRFSGTEKTKIIEAFDLIEKLVTQIELTDHDSGLENEIQSLITELIIMNQTVIQDLQELLTKNRQDTGALDIHSSRRPDLSTKELIAPEIRKKAEKDCFDNLTLIKNKLIILKTEPSQELLDFLFRQIHNFKGNITYYHYEYLEDISYEIENSLNIMKKNSRHIRPELIDAVIIGVDFLLHSILNKQDNRHDPEKTRETKEKIIRNIKEISSGQNYPSTIKPLGEILIEMGVTTAETIQKALSFQKDRLDNMKDDFQKNFLQNNNNELLNQEKSLTSDHQIRFMMNYQFFSLYSDVIVSNLMMQDQFQFIKNYIHEKYTDDPVLSISISEMHNHTLYFTRTLKEIESQIKDVYIQSFEKLYKDIEKVIYQLSSQTGKEIHFIQYGNQLKLDKWVIEEISSPLIHMIRNAVDHGIEQPEDRIRQGKNRYGSISIESRFEKNDLLVIVRDDGKGLDKEAIKDKALKEGILKEENQPFDDQEVYKCIFHPGFTTSGQKNRISGTGYGMNSVKQWVEQTKGSIRIITEENQGSEFRITIPTHLSLREAMHFFTGKHYYSIFLSDIIETIRIRDGVRLQYHSGKPVCQHNGEYYPLIILDNEENTSPEISSINNGWIVITKKDRQKICLYIKELIGSEFILYFSFPNLSE